MEAIVEVSLGGATGTLERRMDKQAEELQQDLKNAPVEREGKGIHIALDSRLLLRPKLGRPAGR